MKRPEYHLLADAWGRMFSDLFLSAKELADEMEQGQHRLGKEREQMLHDFIKADCASGGSVVLDIIRNGGMIDRAALIRIADLEDLAGIRYNGIMALQLLIDACDKKVRPVLIRRAGRHLLSRVYDHRGLPLIFTIFGLCDLCEGDLDAIASVFSQDDLKNTMSRSRSGKNAYEVFLSNSAAMKRYPPLERNTSMVRNAFYIPAAKDAKSEGTEAPVRIRKLDRLPEKKRAG